MRGNARQSADAGVATGNSVCFKVSCPGTNPGEHVRVVGSLPALGSWSPAASTVQLTTSASDFPSWSSAWLRLPELQGSCEYKYVIFGGGEPRWEECDNRLLHPPSPGNRLEVSGTFGSHAGSHEVEQPAPASPSRRTTTFAPPPRVIEKPAPVAEDAPEVERPKAEKPVEEEAELEEAAPRRDRAQTAASRLFEAKPSSELEVAPTLSARRKSEVVMGRKSEFSGQRGRRRTVGAVTELVGLTLCERGPGGADGLMREAHVHEDEPPAQGQHDKAKPASGKAAKAAHRRMSNMMGQVPPELMKHLQSKEPGSTAGAPDGATGRTTADATDVPKAEARKVTEDSIKESDKGKEEEEEEETATATADDGEESSSFSESSSSDEGQGQGNEEDYEANRQDAKVFQDDYEVKGPVGEGAFGAVYRCVRRKGGEELACKVIKKERLEARDIVMLFGDSAAGLAGEISIQHSLPKHDNVVALHSFFEEPQVVRLVMDFCSGGDLFDAILRAADRNRSKSREALALGLEEPAAATVARQLLAALEFLHGQGVVHRDLKPENVLFARPLDEVPLGRGNAVKLCDFGFAARCRPEDGDSFNERCGSLCYVAPEVLANGRRYGLKVDVWSAGAVIFSALRACLPINAKTDAVLVQLARAGRYTFDKGWSAISPEAKALVEHCMTVDDRRRPSAAEVVSAHPWLRKFSEAV